MKRLSGIYATGLVKLIDNMDEICINGKLSAQEPSEWGGFFAYLWVILLYFSPECRLIPAVLELGHVRLLWKLIRSRILQLSQKLSNWSLRVFSKQFSIKIVNYEDGMVILGQKWYILLSKCS